MHFTNKNTRMIFCDFDIIRLAIEKPDSKTLQNRAVKARKMLNCINA